MTNEPMERDAALGEALSTVTGMPADAPVDWHAMRAAITSDAAPELRRRRMRHRRLQFALPAALAAAVFLFVVATRPDGEVALIRPADDTTTQVSIDELLDADVSDREFRALLSGAGEADDLLLIAAGDGRQ